MPFVIVSIKTAKRRRDRVVLTFGPDRTPIELASDVATSFPAIATGSVVEDDEIRRWLEADELARCRRKAWALLALRPRSRMELERALRQRKFPSSVIDKVMTALQQKRYVDDQAFAQLYVEQAQSGGKSGPRLVRQQLAVRGIRGAVADEAILPIENTQSQLESAKSLLQKWNRRSKPDDPAKRRQAAAPFLMRRGFDSEVVWETVREVLGAGEL